MTDYEAATLRARTALCQIAGRVTASESWAIHEVPPELMVMEALPRVAQVVAVDAAKAALLLRSWPLSTLGTVGPAPATAPRVCDPGQMQRPPLVRHHDGVDHLAVVAEWAASTAGGHR
jgi:hypothetical protein